MANCPPFMTEAQLISNLNTMAPAANEASLGNCISDLITSHNLLLTQLAAANITGLPAASLPPQVLLPSQR